jgi:hypothetical protein
MKKKTKKENKIKRKRVTEDVTDLDITPGLEGLNMLEITPGLIGLNLNILHVLDMHMREEAKCPVNSATTTVGVRYSI